MKRDNSGRIVKKFGNIRVDATTHNDIDRAGIQAMKDSVDQLRNKALLVQIVFQLVH